jgi:RimJ/RimL family protein N-acetyltransferase
MKLEGELASERVILRQMKKSDISQNFIRWLSNPDTNRFLEVRHNPPSLGKQRAYVQECEDSSQKLYLGIFLKDSTLIGSTTLTRDSYNSMEIGLMIGGENYRGQGLGSEAVRLVISWAKLEGFNEVTAGYLRGNEASAKLFSSLGFEIVHDMLTVEPVWQETAVIKTSLKLRT